MSEMIEIVARALMAKIRETSDEKLDPEHFRELARAAIEAMREPISEMCSDGASSADHLSAAGAKYVWHSMVDAALR